MGQFHCGEWFAGLLTLGLGDMVHPDPCDLGLVEDGLELVAKEHADLALIGEITSEVGEEGIGDDEIELGLVDEAAGVGEELVVGAGGLGAELQVLLELVHLFDGDLLVCHPAEGLGEIAAIVLGLDDTDLQRFDRSDAEEVEAEAPADDDLHHQTGLTDAGAAADDHRGAASDPSIPDEIVRIILRIEVEEVFDRDDGGLILIGFAVGEPILPGCRPEVGIQQPLLRGRAAPCAGQARVARGVLVLGIDAGDYPIDLIPAGVPLLAGWGIDPDPAVDALATGVDEDGDGQARVPEALLLLVLGQVIELDKDMAVGGDIVVAAAVEVGPEGVDADKDPLALRGQDAGGGIIEAGDPFLDGDEGAGTDWPTLLDSVANADDFGGCECGLHEASELTGLRIWRGLE